MKTRILSIAALMLAFMSCNKPAEQKQNLNEEKICEAKKARMRPCTSKTE